MLNHNKCLQLETGEFIEFWKKKLVELLPKLNYLNLKLKIRIYEGYLIEIT